MVACEGLHPQLVLSGPLGQSLFRDGADSVYIAEEMDDMFRTCQQRQISLDDDAVETVVYKNQQAAEQLAEDFHRSSPGDGIYNQIIGQRTDGSLLRLCHEKLP